MGSAWPPALSGCLTWPERRSLPRFIAAAPTMSAAPGPVGAAVALRAVLPQTDALTCPELDLLQEWLDRITGQAR